MREPYIAFSITMTGARRWACGRDKMSALLKLTPFLLTMTRCLKLATIASLLLVAYAHAEDTPADVVHQLTDAVRKNDPAKVAVLHASIDGKAPDLTWLDELYERPGEHEFISPTWCLDTKIDGEAAVAVLGFYKRMLDIDPCYMIRIGKQWRILPGETDFESSRSALPAATVKSLEKLKLWYDARTVEIGDELEAEAHKTWKKSEPPTREEGRELAISLLAKRDPKGFSTPKNK